MGIILVQVKNLNNSHNKTMIIMISIQIQTKIMKNNNKLKNNYKLKEFLKMQYNKLMNNIKKMWKSVRKNL